MKKLLFVALAAALTLTACDKKGTTQQAEAEAPAVVESGDVVYVELEKMMSECDLYKNEGKALENKVQKAQESWVKKEQELQSRAASLQERYNKGLMTTSDAQKQQATLEQSAATYQRNRESQAQTLDEENYVYMNRATDLVKRALEAVNSDKRYKMILNSNTLLDADTTLNITSIVLAKVNELYAADKAAEAATK